MSFVGKSCVTLICICVLSPVVWGQKKVTKVAQAVTAKPTVSLPRPPLAKAGEIPPVSTLLRQNFMHGWNLAMDTRLTRNVAQQTKKSISTPSTALTQRKQYVEEKIKPLRDFMETHQNNWPRYGKSKQDNHLLRYVLSFMEVDKPSPEEIELQREIIRLRAQSNAWSPYEIVSTVGAMMEYGIVPARAVAGGKELQEDADVTALAEETAFAMAAAKVPMKNNPWKKISGFNRIADMVSTYYAMRRQDFFTEGIPETHIGDGKIHYPNIPLLTKKQYLLEQNRFATEHPFEFALAPFWEKMFHSSFYRIFNSLSFVEKQAVLFTAPQLPMAVDATTMAACYNNAVRAWTEQHGREPKSYTVAYRTEQLQRFLANPQEVRPFRFNVNEELKTFIDMSNEQQVEVLMWIWQNWQISPVEALKSFEADKKSFF